MLSQIPSNSSCCNFSTLSNIGRVTSCFNNLKIHELLSSDNMSNCYSPSKSSRKHFSTNIVDEASESTSPEEKRDEKVARFGSSKAEIGPGGIVLSDNFEAIPITKPMSVFAPKKAEKRKTPEHLKFKSISAEMGPMYFPDSVFSSENKTNFNPETGEMLPLTLRLKANRIEREIEKANAPMSVRDPGNPLAQPYWEKTWLRRNAEYVLAIAGFISVGTVMFALYTAMMGNPNEKDQKFRWKIGEYCAIFCWLFGICIWVIIGYT